MNIPTIEPNKHIGILFQPRSGSHVVRHFLSSVTNNIDLGEVFNPVCYSGKNRLSRLNTELVGNRKLINSLNDAQEIVTSEEIKNKALPDAIANIETLKVENELNNHTIFTIHSSGYYQYRPELFKNLADANYIQYIRLERADVLTSYLSIETARETKNWHRLFDSNQLPEDFPTELPLQRMQISIEHLVDRLKVYVNTCIDIDEYFPNVPTIYYEQFQYNVANLRNMFNGVPKKIVSIPYLKIGTNYKEWIDNIDEVENVYEQFVNEHKEYFPQYFGKLPHIKIPASQGRQPRDLSQLQMAVGI